MAPSAAVRPQRKVPASRKRCSIVSNGRRLDPEHATEGQPAQGSESFVGPYELQDFHLYLILRFGFTPAKVAFLAHQAWGDKYPLAEIKRHLRTFIWRFFKTSQFKRSAMPNAPKVGSGGSCTLSPRGDSRAPPSDSGRWPGCTISTASLTAEPRAPIVRAPSRRVLDLMTRLRVRSSR